LHYDWHWVWPTGNGDLGNQGIHQMDIARWFLGEDALSPRVFSVGGRLGYVDDGTTPNTQIVYHDYPKAPLIFEVRGLPEKTDSKEMDKYKGGSVAVIIECADGYLLVPDYRRVIAFDASGKEVKRFEGARDHHANWLQAVQSRKVSDLTADILEGHLSSALCHTGNISYLLGKEASPEQIRDQIKQDRDAVPTFERMAEHLAANGVDINSAKLAMGPVLKMDPAKEQFIGSDAANKLLTREYRKPFVVPEKI
jgi:predicted dehydrogenase